MKYGKKLLFLPNLTSVRLRLHSGIELRITNYELWKKLKFSLFVILASCFMILASALAVRAQESDSNYDVTVTPVFFDLSVNPGGSLDESVRVRNNSSSPITVQVEVNKLTGDETGALTITDENDDDSSLNWFTFEETEYELSPLEWTTIPYTITVPDTAAYGYYFTINFTQTGVDEAGTTGATVSGSAAVPILLNVRSDGAIADAKLADFSVGNYINEYLPVEFSVEIENTGNIHVRPVGNIFISGNGQDNISSIDVNDGSGAIIPNTTRTFESNWTNGFIVRETTVVDGEEVTKLKINWNQLTDFRFGKYTANLIMVYDSGERDVPIEGSVAFWVIPYKVIIGGIILIIVVLLVGRWALRRYINREVRKRSK